MRARTIKGSPERSASDAWGEVERMIRETLAPASAIEDGDVELAVGELTGVGRTLIAAGVLAEEPLVLDAAPLRLEIRVSLANDALKGEELLGRVTGAASASEWKIYVPDRAPFAEQVAEAISRHDALRAGSAPAESTTSSASSSSRVTDSSSALIDTAALRRRSVENRS